MEQIERIQAMEAILRRGEEACRALDEALEHFEALRPEIEALGAYYGSELWFHDLDCDRAGRLPAELKRGVLSEDEAWDLLQAWAALCQRLR